MFVEHFPYWVVVVAFFVLRLDSVLGTVHIALVVVVADERWWLPAGVVAAFEFIPMSAAKPVLVKVAIVAAVGAYLVRKQTIAPLHIPNRIEAHHSPRPCLR